MPDDSKNKEPVVNFTIIHSVEDYLEKSGKFRCECQSFEIPGRDSGGARTLYIPYCNKQRFDFGAILNDFRGHGAFTPPEKGAKYSPVDWTLYVEHFHDIRCPNPCAGYVDGRFLPRPLPSGEPSSNRVDLEKSVPDAQKLTPKERKTTVWIPLGIAVFILLLGALLTMINPEIRRWLGLDNQPPSTAVGSIVNNGGTVNNPVINNAPAQVPPLYQLNDERKKLFLNKLAEQPTGKDVLRVGCTDWSEGSCVAAGRFLLLFSQAGFVIDQNKVFRMDELVPTEGVSLVVHSDPSQPKEPLPPHLGRWHKMDDTEKVVYFAFQVLKIPVNSATDDTLGQNMLGVYFGPEPK